MFWLMKTYKVCFLVILQFFRQLPPSSSQHILTAWVTATLHTLPLSSELRRLAHKSEGLSESKVVLERPAQGHAEIKPPLSEPFLLSRHSTQRNAVVSSHTHIRLSVNVTLFSLVLQFAHPTGLYHRASLHKRRTPGEEPPSPISPSTVPTTTTFPDFFKVRTDCRPDGEIRADCSFLLYILRRET